MQSENDKYILNYKAPIQTLTNTHYFLRIPQSQLSNFVENGLN